MKNALKIAVGLLIVCIAVVTTGIIKLADKIPELPEEISQISHDQAHMDTMYVYIDSAGKPVIEMRNYERKHGKAPRRGINQFDKD